MPPEQRPNRFRIYTDTSDFTRVEYGDVVVLQEHSYLTVDASENSRRAVSYIAQVLKGVSGFRVSILHIIQDPEEDYFSSSAERDQWLDKYRDRMGRELAAYRQILIGAGFDPAQVLV